ncbi:hypothetical protein H7X46_26635 [Pseudonocardia sp. C8]|uniref:hypothetical protein n=1 Tax=Pseudonocardia sp. C8 TaxID=2762759 RepID=UPI00164350D8|nr:hypothetical protein [Pseudonocardia sp. C8]MBC3194631.1 hypothetical protein [Pseudonocardia sp. C8]
MALPRCYAFEAFDMATKFAWVKGQPGMSAAQQVSDGLTSLTDNLGAARDATDGASKRLGIAWQGPAADAAQTSLTATADGVSDSATIARNGADRMIDHGHSFEAMRRQIEYLDPAEFSWLQRAGDNLGEAWHSVWGNGTDHVTIAEHNQANDEVANRALHQYATQTSATDDRFTTGVAPPPAPSGGAGHGGSAAPATAGASSGDGAASHPGVAALPGGGGLPGRTGVPSAPGGAGVPVVPGGAGGPVAPGGAGGPTTTGGTAPAPGVPGPPAGIPGGGPGGPSPDGRPGDPRGPGGAGDGPPAGGADRPAPMVTAPQDSGPSPAGSAPSGPYTPGPERGPGAGAASPYPSYDRPVAAPIPTVPGPDAGRVRDDLARRFADGARQQQMARPPAPFPGGAYGRVPGELYGSGRGIGGPHGIGRGSGDPHGVLGRGLGDPHGPAGRGSGDPHGVLGRGSGDPHGPGGRGSGAWAATDPRTSGVRAGEPGGYAGRTTEAGRGSGIPGYGPMMGAGPRDGQEHRNRYVVPTGEVFDVEVTATDPVLGPDQDQR